jgi:hypothetical protein
MVDFIADPVQIVRQFNAFVFGANVPAQAAEKLQSIPGTSADVISQGREILYAHFDLLNDEGKTVLAQMAHYAVSQGWQGENSNNRCDNMVKLARFSLGEIQTAPSAENTPDPRTGLRDGSVDWREIEQP